jgi:hypothetical protein
VSPARRTVQPPVRYRATVTELVDRQASVVMDAARAGFHAAVGELADGRLRAEHGIGGEPPLLEHLAQLIARPTDRPHNQTRYRGS